MALNLYEIKEKYLYFLQQVEDGAIPEEFIQDTLEGIEGEFEDKVDNIACYVKSQLAEAKAIKDEIDALTERKKAKETKAENMLNYISKMMIASKKKKIETPRNVLSFRASTSTVVDENFIAWAKQEGFLELIRTKIVEEPEKAEIKNALNAGKSLKYCSLQVSENLQLK
jgi:hypothetical protein